MTNYKGGTVSAKGADQSGRYYVVDFTNPPASFRLYVGDVPDGGWDLLEEGWVNDYGVEAETDASGAVADIRLVKA